MGWDFRSEEAVYSQIAAKLRKDILGGRYAPEEQIPSVRAIAYDAAVNPNTVQHALSLLEEEKLLETRGTAGKFVTGDRSVIEEARKKAATALISGFMNSMNELGLEINDISALFESLYGRDIEK